MQTPGPALVLVALLGMTAAGGCAAGVSAVMAVGVANAPPGVLAAGLDGGVLWVEGTDPNGGDDLVAARFHLADGTVRPGTPRPAQGEARRFEASADGVQGEVRAVVEDFFGAAANATFSVPPPSSALPLGRPTVPGGFQAFGVGGRRVSEAGVALAVFAAAVLAIASRRPRR